MAAHCDLCQGTGRLVYGSAEGQTCPSCRGTGTAPPGRWGLVQKIIPLVLFAALAVAAGYWFN